MEKKKLAVLAASVGLLAAGSGLTWAAIPAVDGVIHGCYSTSALGTGGLYVIDDAASCPSGYTALNWNQTAPSGLQGYEVVQENFTVNGPTGAGSRSFTIECPAGKVALGASFKADIIATQPLTDGSGWDFEVQHPSVGSGGSYNSSGLVTCATAE